jgi:hypothetical protein
MRKFWKIENNVNVRNAETRKSRKAVNKKIVKPAKCQTFSIYEIHPKFREMQEALIEVKQLVNLKTAKAILEEFAYEKVHDVQGIHVEAILRKARKVIYDYTH